MNTMHISLEAGLPFFTIAGVIGLFAERTSICTVKAVLEILTT